MAEMRVCPDCGEPAGTQAFCSSCGLNLTGVARLPTHAEWKQSTLSGGHTEAQQIAASLETIGTLLPFQHDPKTTSQTAVLAIQGAVRMAIPREHRGNRVVVAAQDTADQSGGTSVMATIALSDGALLEQKFDVSKIDGNARINVMRSGRPQLVVPGVEKPIEMTTHVPPTSHALPSEQQALRLSPSDAEELAARRAHDAKLEARLHGWKPLPIWYAFWATLAGIGAISALTAGQVGAFFVCIVICALCVMYVHYLDNGGRRRVWFVFW